MDNAIEATGLTHRSGSTQALDGVDLTVPEGTVLGVLGPDGAGKTTAVRVLATLLRPDSGSARVAGIDVFADEEMWEVVRRVVADGSSVLLTAAGGAGAQARARPAPRRGPRGVRGTRPAHRDRRRSALVARRVSRARRRP